MESRQVHRVSSHAAYCAYAHREKTNVKDSIRFVRYVAIVNGFSGDHRTTIERVLAYCIDIMHILHEQKHLNVLGESSTRRLSLLL